jgi:hypothetical protein
VEIGTADTAVVDFDVDIIGVEGLGSELVEAEVGPVFRCLGLAWGVLELAFAVFQKHVMMKNFESSANWTGKIYHRKRRNR